MVLWHNEEDTLRSPLEVKAGDSVGLWIGTHPLEPGQHVSMKWQVTHANGEVLSGETDVLWQYNDSGRRNSYWLATLGPFEEGDKVEYAIRGQSVGGPTGPISYTFIVGLQKVSPELE